LAHDDRPNIQFRRKLDEMVDRIGRKYVNALALHNLGDHRSDLHHITSLVIGWPAAIASVISTMNIRRRGSRAADRNGLDWLN
jgi:hypothetical protein